MIPSGNLPRTWQMGRWGLCNVTATSTGAGLWACPILHLSFQSCLSPPDATLQLDSLPSVPSVLIIARACMPSNHLTCRSSCSYACACIRVPSSPARTQQCSTAASSTTSSASPVKRRKEHGRLLGPAPGPRCVWSLTRPSQPDCPRLSTSTTLSPLTSRRLHCGFQDFRLRFCTQEKGNCPGQTGALPVDGCGPGPISN